MDRVGCCKTYMLRAAQTTVEQTHPDQGAAQADVEQTCLGQHSLLQSRHVQGQLHKLQ
jgi:hypothetical protein